MIALIPAYGRVYATAEEAAADWESGKDFKIHGGPYTSIRDHDSLVNDYNVILIYWDLSEDKT